MFASFIYDFLLLCYIYLILNSLSLFISSNTTAHTYTHREINNNKNRCHIASMKSYLICKSFTAKPRIEFYFYKLILFTDFDIKPTIIPTIPIPHTIQKKYVFHHKKNDFSSIFSSSLIVDYDGGKMRRVTLLSMMNKLYIFLLYILAM